MSIQVYFFASLREALECEQIQIDLQEINLQSPQPLTVIHLTQYILDTNPNWQQAFQKNLVYAAVNQQLATDQTQIDEDAEVAYFPAISGG